MNLIIYLHQRKSKFDAPSPLDMSSIRQKREDVVGINFIRELELSIKKRNVHCVHKRAVVFHVFLIDHKIRQTVINCNTHFIIGQVFFSFVNNMNRLSYTS